jgi:hypothetical protein
MSTAFYPLGMKTYNNHTHQGGYKTWKGNGVFSNPVGVTASHIRPLTNNDPGNVFQTGFGLPRPIKHYRKGRVIPSQPILVEDPNSPGNYIETNESDLINYNMNRIVKSSKGASLGGGGGGLGLLNQMLDNPGGYIVKQNNPSEINNIDQLSKDCKTCEGIGIVASYYPNTTYLTENPEPNTQNKVWCCNAEKKAIRRVRPASTILKKNYYTTLQQYRQNRCKTFEQRSFNFQSPNPVDIAALNTGNPFITKAELLAAKPGSPLALFNTYFANCQPNGEIYEATEDALIGKMLAIMYNNSILTQQQINEFQSLNINTINDFFTWLNTLPEPTKDLALNVFVDFINNPYYGVPFSGPSNPAGCKLVVYKPNNPQFAIQGAVSSSTRMLKLNVDTIQTNAASFNKNKANLNIPVTEITGSINPFILKNKVPACNNPAIIRFQNKKACYLTPRYNLYGIPSQPPFSSNHFAQSPVNPLM